MDVENIKPADSASVDQSVQDARDLATMGHDQALSRKFDLWSMLALAFCVLGTYSTFAQGLSSGLTNGGPITILWGLVLVTACNLCVAVSLGELTSSMPTALGQAYWVYRLWHTPTGRFVSYLCAWINTFGWWTLTASQIAFMTEFLLGMKVTFDEDWGGAGVGWLQFVIYLGLVLVLTVVNVVGCRREKILPWLNGFVGVWFTGCLWCYLSFQPGRFVFGAWINQTGWSDGVVWFTGLVQAAYGLTAFDAVIHMVEEMPAPRINAPRVTYLAVLSGAVTGFIFMVVCLFCMQDVDRIVDSPSGLPFIELMLETGISILTTASRLTWGFARDGGLPWSRYLTVVDPAWKAPVRALWAQGVLIALVGVLYLFANTVLEAILSVSTIALTISYALPIAVLLFVGRDQLPPGPFRLGRWGTVVNWISVVYCAITTVFFFFPGSPDPAPGDMNYAIAVFGVMLVVAVAFWFIQGSRTYLQTADAIAQLILAQGLELEPEPRKKSDL
ncbi:putative amino acid permease family protein [Aspergillus novofumigatus IBT 16806]|uniref:Putative amino acid permease family protein n=1 Tax=Aspergillus novofumigatus (strain IBT 16806) TaxID=1392255 RepID=A0A2I1C6W9_ASPN1|nr:putative amino acid permease family protein [Aspergillus novofumigatus IBT 16806]PKX93378.1 putative amino acid permease family protein [Aspergillus novofumigatus IBT 16806]